MRGDEVGSVEDSGCEWEYGKDNENEKEDRNGEDSETDWWNWIRANGSAIAKKETDSNNVIYNMISNIYYLSDNCL